MSKPLSLAEVVLGKLLVQQRHEGLSDERLGDRLGIHQAQMTRLRLGRIGAGARVLDGAALEYPELVVAAVREVAGRPLLCDLDGCPGIADGVEGVHMVGSVGAP